MKIDIKHLAKLSKLNITNEQEEKFAAQMETIVDMVEKLPVLLNKDNMVDPSNPMICREDVAHNDFKRDQLLSNAPQMQAGCVVVPKIIE